MVELGLPIEELWGANEHPSERWKETPWTKVNKKKHASIFQIHGARKGLGWAGPGVRWGGRGGMVSTSLLLINTGKSSHRHIIVSL